MSVSAEHVVLIDYGVSNLGSLRSMLDRLGVQHKTASCPDELLTARRLILPGVGAFDQGAETLLRSGMIPVLETLVLRQRVPLLGICLGMQLLMKESEEGRSPGLGWIEGECLRIRGENLRVPHLGWNSIELTRPDPLLPDVAGERRFYFAHSYYVRCSDQAAVIGRTHYGSAFASVIRRDNIVGVQFHPEKSHRFGSALLRAFIDN